MTEIRTDQTIGGLRVGNVDIKVTAYADDVTVVLDGTPTSLENCVSLFEAFRSISGLQLNRQKTRPFWIGKHATRERPICNHLDLSWEETPLEVLGVKIPNDPEADIGSLNYDAKINSLKTRLALWSYRYLTPYGRVHLVKTEALSQLVYLMTVLPKPNPTSIKSIERIIFNFIWGNKKDKIKRATLKSKYKQGGLQVPDIDCKADSLKMTWIKKYIDTDVISSWKKIVEPMFSLTNEVNIFECSMSPDIIHRKIKSDFWREVIVVWNKIKMSERTELTGQLVLSQVLYFNSHLKLELSGFYEWKRLVRNNVVRVGNLYDVHSKRMFTAEELIAKYGFNALSAIVLLAAIPNEWKRTVISDKPTVFQNYSADLLDLSSVKRVTSWAYQKLLNSCKTSQPEVSQSKWSRELNLPADMQWTVVYERLYDTTDDITLRWLQFRLLHRILPTNKRLQIFGIVDSNECHHCPTIPESLLHVFWDCEAVQKFWREVKRVYKTSLERSSVVLNVFQKGSPCMSIDSLQLLTLLAKQYIWRSRMHRTLPSVEGLAKTIFSTYRVEKYVSAITGKTSKCDTRWGPLLRPLAQWGEGQR